MGWWMGVNGPQMGVDGNGHEWDEEGRGWVAEGELFTLLHLFLPDSYWTPGILPDWTRTGTNFMLADHHTNFVSQS